MSLRLRHYTDPGEIRLRLSVLYEKADRIVLYNWSVEHGEPDVGLLDEKQRAILAKYRRQPGDLFPGCVRRTLARTIDTLETRRRRLERIAAQQRQRVAA